MNLADRYVFLNLNEILEEGVKDENPRPKYSDGVPAHTFFINHAVRAYRLDEGEFPITTLRPIAWKTGIKEILWIYQDQSNDLRLLRDKYNVHYWDLWQSKDAPGTIGARYGEVVRRYHLMDDLLDGLKNDPFGRRHIIDLYQYQELEETDGLYPCAFCTIWNVRPVDGVMYLDVMLVQRSGDYMAASGAGGINEVQYAALLMMVARHCGYEPGQLMHVIANEHIYDRHIEQAEEMLRRYEMLYENAELRNAPSPKLILNPEKTNFYDFTIDDFTIENYTPFQPQLKLELGI